MADAARVRIVRVRPKPGCAELHILPSPERPAMPVICQAIHGWAEAATARSDEPPQAFLAIAFRVDPDHPGANRVVVMWRSEHYAFPTNLLPTMALAAVQQEMTIRSAEDEIMTNLGYTPGGGSPR